MVSGSPDSKHRSSRGTDSAAEQPAALFPEKMLSPGLPVDASSPLAAPRSSLQPHHPRCNLSFCPLCLPLLGVHVTARTEAVWDVSRAGDSVLSPAAHGVTISSLCLGCNSCSQGIHCQVLFASNAHMFSG